MLTFPAPSDQAALGIPGLQGQVGEAPLELGPGQPLDQSLPLNAFMSATQVAFGLVKPSGLGSL